jgi:hypothetical protein
MVTLASESDLYWIIFSFLEEAEYMT